MAEFLTQKGQQILPAVELITQSRMVIDDLVDAVRRATIEAVLRLSAEHMAGPPQQGRSLDAWNWAPAFPQLPDRRDRFLRQAPRLIAFEVLRRRKAP